jgi:dolichol phosphate-mannose biosynthesis regulatory protein
LNISLSGSFVTLANQPFVDEPHLLYSFFPPREWAIRIPVILLLLGSTVVGTFIGLVMLRAAQKEKAKQQAKKTK